VSLFVLVFLRVNSDQLWYSDLQKAAASGADVAADLEALRRQSAAIAPDTFEVVFSNMLELAALLKPVSGRTKEDGVTRQAGGRTSVTPSTYAARRVFLHYMETKQQPLHEKQQRDIRNIPNIAIKIGLDHTYKYESHTLLIELSA
jgi:hypothetical protein